MDDSGERDISDLVEFLIRELAVNDWNDGLTVPQILERIDIFYDNQERLHAEAEEDAPGEDDPDAEAEAEPHPAPKWTRPLNDHAFQERVWNTLVNHPDIIDGNRDDGECNITLDEALARPIKPRVEGQGPASLKPAQVEGAEGAIDDTEYQPRLQVDQDRLWLVLTGHEVDRNRLPFSEWQLLLAIAAAGRKGIIQADATKKTGQDKRSVPRRTDFLFQKGYIDKRQVLANSQKTSLLVHRIFLDNPDDPSEIPDPSKVPRSVLIKDLSPIPGHEHWTGSCIDTEMFAKATFAIIRAWGVLRRTHILEKMKVRDLRLRKTLERTLRKFFDLEICKRVSAVLPDSPKIFKDCIKYAREPTEAEWSHFKKRLTSQNFKNRPSRAKPKELHKPRKSRKGTAQKRKGRKSMLDDSADSAADSEDGSESGSDISDDDEGQMPGDSSQFVEPSPEDFKKQLADAVEHAIVAIPGGDGIVEDDLLIELQGVEVEELHSLFEPLDDAAPEAFDIASLRLIQEPIKKGSNDTFQYHVAEDFVKHVHDGDTNWNDVNVVRKSKQDEQHVETMSSALVDTAAPSLLKQATNNAASSAVAADSADPPSTPGSSIKTPASTLTKSVRKGKAKAKATPSSLSVSTPKTASPSIRLGPKAPKPRGRPKRDGNAIYTSYQQLQREDGVPGVYWDVPEYTIKVRGTPKFLGMQRKKRFMIIFKTSRLSEVDFTPKEPKPHVPLKPAVEAEIRASSVSEPGTPATSSSRDAMSIDAILSPAIDVSERAETPQKSFLDVVNGPTTPIEAPIQDSTPSSSMARPSSSLSIPKPRRRTAPVRKSSALQSVETTEPPVPDAPAPRDKGKGREPSMMELLNNDESAMDVDAPASEPQPEPTEGRRRSSRHSSAAAMERMQAAARASEQLDDDFAVDSDSDASMTDADDAAVAGDADADADFDGDAMEIDDDHQAARPTRSKAAQANANQHALTGEQFQNDKRISAAAHEIFPNEDWKLPVLSLSRDIVGNLCIDAESTRLVFYPLNIINMDAKFEIDGNTICDVELDVEKYQFSLIKKTEDGGNKKPDSASGEVPQSLGPAENRGDDTTGDEPARPEGAADENANAASGHEPAAPDAPDSIKFAISSSMVFQAKRMKSKVMHGINARKLEAKRAAIPPWGYPVPNGGPKPYKCDTCDLSWKNYEGIKYHKTKSKCKCNPDYVEVPKPTREELKELKLKKGFVYVPETEAAESPAGDRPAAPEKPNFFPKTPAGRPKRRTARQSFVNDLATPVPVLPGRAQDDPEDGDYREKKKPKLSPAKKAAKAKSEGTTPSKKVVNEPVVPYPPEKQQIVKVKTRLKYPLAQDRDNIERRTGALVTQQRKDIVLELIEANGGAFPGDQGIWYAMHAVWKKRYPDAITLDYKYCNQAVSLLEDSGKITKLKFSFKDFTMRTRTRAVITKKGMNPIGPEVTAIKERIKQAFPRYYCPPEYAPPPAVMIQLESREMRLPEEERMKRQWELEQQVDPKIRLQQEQAKLQEARDLAKAATFPSASQPPKIPSVYTGTGKRKDRYEYEEETSSSEEEIEILAAPFYAPENEAERDKPDIKIPPLLRGSPLKKIGVPKATVKHIRSARMRALWQSLKENSTILRDLVTNADVFVHDNALIVEEPEHEDCLMETEWPEAPIENGWMAVPAYLQCADGTWAAPAIGDATTKCKHLPPLPEPITYMQSFNNPTWSYRPFGHGADPIYARPSKRFDGNVDAPPIDNAFRPIVICTKRLYKSHIRKHEIYRRLAYVPVEYDKRKYRVTDSGALERKRKDRPELAMEGGMYAYGLTENGEEIPWPDFRPMLLSSTRGFRTRSIMPEWSRNPGLASLVARDQQSPGETDAEGDVEMGGTSVAGDAMPADLEGVIDLAKGSDFCKLPETGNPVYYGIEATARYEQTIKGEQNLLKTSVEPGSIFINHTVETIQSVPPAELKWSDENHFTLETLPYALLAYDPSEVAYKPYKEKRKYNKRQKVELATSYCTMMGEVSDFDDGTAFNRRKRRLAEVYATNQEPKVKRTYRRAAQRIDFKVRRLTQVPMDLKGIELPKDDPDYEVVVSSMEFPGHRKRTNDRTIVSDAFDDRLIVAVVVVRTLLGGLDQSVDWVLIHHLFPMCTMNWLNRHFNILADKHTKRVEKLVEDFQQIFLEAYAADEIPPLDYDHVLDYDWEGLVNWTMERTQSMASQSVNLPASREYFDNHYTIHDTEERIYRDSYFNPGLPVHKRTAHATVVNGVLPVVPKKEATMSAKEDALRIARSWARASTLTPQATFDAVTAAAKLHSFDKSIMRDALSQLLDAKVIMPVNKGRPVPGRGFEVTDTLYGCFSRLLSRSHFDEAAVFKRRLDEAFRAGRTVPIEYTASEGEVLAITNLQAHGRILLTGINVPTNKFGLTGGNYQTRRMDKTKLHFDIEISPTEKYMYDSEHPLTLTGVLDYHRCPPKLPEDGALPLWFDINGELMPGLWKKVVAMVISVIMTRSGTKVADVARLCKPALEEWEVALVVDWLLAVGAVRKFSEEMECWVVGEWWWWAVGQV